VLEKAYTKSYGKGLKMMKNMNFEVGAGVGKAKQGIVAPVQAVVWGDKKGLGSKPQLN